MNQASQATSAVAEAQRGIRYRVLIVEDDADIRELIRYNLAQEGFIVEEAADGAQALDEGQAPRARSDGARPDAAGDAGACRSAARCAPSAKPRICRF